jgi:hypothetical protein
MKLLPFQPHKLHFKKALSIYFEPLWKHFALKSGNNKMHNFALITQSGFQKTQNLTLISKQMKNSKKSLYKNVGL